MTQKYATIRLRAELVQRVKRIVNMQLGYRSVADFTAEALRKRLEEVEEFLVKTGQQPKSLPTPLGEGNAGLGQEGGSEAEILKVNVK